LKVEGACHCGKISYEADVDPDTVTICHCTDCQKLTGTVYRVGIPAPAKTFVLKGEPKTFVKTAESGTKRVHAFCPECGTPVYSAAISNPTHYTNCIRPGGKSGPAPRCPGLATFAISRVTNASLEQPRDHTSLAISVNRNCVRNANPLYASVGHVPPPGRDYSGRNRP
jgi:hypothetical protein